MEYLDTQSLLVTSLVCHDWKVKAILIPFRQLLTTRHKNISDPLLYRRIVLWSAWRLQRLAETMQLSTPLMGTWLRDLKFDFQSQFNDQHNSDKIALDLIIILTRCPHLRSLTLLWSHHPSIMDVAKDTSRSTLERLELEFMESSSPSLSSIGDFTHLRSLQLDLWGDTSLPRNITKWQLPLLVDLTIIGYEGLDLSISKFICGCQFDSLQSFLYHDPDITAEQSPIFAAFLQKSTCLESLDLGTTLLSYELISQIPPSVKSFTLNIMDSTPMPNLPKTIRRLVINYNLDIKLTSLWNAITKVIDSSAPGLWEIQIEGETSFKWVSQDNRYDPRLCELVAGLLGFSGQLAKKGIVLLDSGGKTVHEYFNIQPWKVSGSQEIQTCSI
jgi:hypothetical protein